MKTSRIAIVVILLAIFFTVSQTPAWAQVEKPLPPSPSAAEVRALGLPDTIAADTKVVKLAGNFAFTEGATTAPNGDVYFVDYFNGKILRWDVVAETLSTFLAPSGHASGLYFDAKGNLIACTSEKNELWSITPDGKHTVLVSSYEGKPLDGPNDLWVHPMGGIYITDPMYRAPWWDPAVARPSQPVRAVYYLKPDLKTLVRVAELNMPNGVVGTPDGRTLFVADINVRTVWRFDIQPDGTLSNKKMLCNFSADGITLDELGNLYLTANLGGGRGGANPVGPTSGVTVVETKTGNPIGFIPVPEQPSNLAFGGKSRDILYITARSGFYSIQTKVRGANAAK